jgi:hypothetical protein
MRIGEDSPVFAIGGKTRPGVDLSQFEGAAMRMRLLTLDRDVVVIVPSRDSDAKRDGKDVLFMTCSERCGRELKAVLKEETVLGSMLEGFEAQ